MENIKVGDLVMVVKPRECCGDASTVGLIFVVKEIKSSFTRCPICGNSGSEIRVISDIKVNNGRNFHPLITRLKKIQPLSELDTIETKKDLPCEV